jgi:threonine aldolase
LKNHINRLQQDHTHAKKIADVLQKNPFCKAVLPVETNIILFQATPPYSASDIVKKLENHGIRTIAMTKELVRMVLHLDITPGMVDHTCRTIESWND